MDLRALFLNDRVAAALVTALVGGGVVAAGWFWTHALSRRRDRQLRDERVGDIQRALLAEIRALLSLCFPKDPEFRVQRHHWEVPAWRCCLRSRDGTLIAQVAVHEKQITVGGSLVPIAGVAEVAVHPDFRGRGLATLVIHTAGTRLESIKLPCLDDGDAEALRSTLAARTEPERDDD